MIKSKTQNNAWQSWTLNSPWNKLMLSVSETQMIPNARGHVCWEHGILELSDFEVNATSNGLCCSSAFGTRCGMAVLHGLVNVNHDPNWFPLQHASLA